MSGFKGNVDDFGMDTISLAGPLEAKLKAILEAGFSQAMLSARDVVGHAQGLEAAVKAKLWQIWSSACTALVTEGIIPLRSSRTITNKCPCERWL